MIGFFTPRYIKDGQELLKAAQKMMHYKRDLLSAADIAVIEAEMRRMSGALHRRDKEEISAAGQKLDEIFGGHFPTPKDFATRENCEVFLVAIVIAVGVRTFFLQPFTIPTGSMQPTLNGILATVTNEPAPNLFKQALDMVLLGRSYVDAVSKEDDTIVSYRDVTRLRFINYTEVQCVKQHFLIHAPADKAFNDFGIRPGRTLKAGEVIARGYVNTGDHVFVDKMSFNFRAPKNGEVFVFNTAGILTRENVTNPGAPSQYYIKRIGGIPGDLLRIDPPNLYINGARAKGFAFERVMACKDGYHGYSNAPAGGGRFSYLNSPDATVHLPGRCYFALGDNSYNSSDSRDWGVVPEQNLMGRGLFVYWPFTSHWGLIK